MTCFANSFGAARDYRWPRCRMKRCISVASSFPEVHANCTSKLNENCAAIGRHNHGAWLGSCKLFYLTIPGGVGGTI
jgi:hypothetical protein